MNKTVKLGTVEIGKSRASVFCKIETKNGRLSISGVEGPLKNGDCVGSCGQIDMHLRERVEEIDPADGWTADLLRRFFEVWRAWHLNDMRAGCVHQRAAWNIEEKIEVVTYALTTEAWQEQNRIKEKIVTLAQRGEVVTLTDEERAILALPWELHEAPDADSAGSGRYTVKKRETKGAGWVYPKEHPRGLLMKPCEVCGYKYGSAWLKEDVPAEVIGFLKGLPESDTVPAWV